MTSAKSRRERATRLKAQRRERRRHTRATSDDSPSDPKSVWIEQYSVATGTAAVLELKLRLVADLFPELTEARTDRAKPGAVRNAVAHHDTNIEGIRQALGTAFHKRGFSISKTDSRTLQHAIELRNDLMHTDFHGARELLHKAGVAPASGGVLQVPVPTGGPTDVLNALLSLRDAMPVSEMASSVGGTYGWLLELGVAGYFREAVGKFQKAIEIVDGLAQKASTLPRRIDGDEAVGVT